jgi:hypothetical protein
MNGDPRRATSDGPYRRICVTPVRNEAWIIDPFVAAAKTWASDVVVADQGSTDGTLERLQERSGVSVVINDSPVYDESHRQRLLLERARQIPGKRLLIGLDADEALSANVSTSEEWRQLDAVAPGTILRFRWVNVLPGFQDAWIPPEPCAFGFVDDGSEHQGQRIHSPRVPQPVGAPTLDLNDVVVLHFQYMAWERMVSKHRWYQVWEHVTHRQKGPLQIFREYRHMYGSWDKSEIHPVRPEWLEGYSRRGIDFQSLRSEPATWWDKEVLQMLQRHGPDHFRKIDIWDKDWNEVAALGGTRCGDFFDPRSAVETSVHRLLKATQGHRGNPIVRAFEKSLRMAGW